MATDGDRILVLFNEALDCAPADRAAFLDRACGDDRALRAELDSLLEAGERPCELLDERESGFVAQVAPSPEGLVGQQLGPFRVTEWIGAGGMGVVYRAEQETPKRVVALKVLQGHSNEWSATRGRFAREAEVAARLNHPNVCTVYEVGDDGGVPYIAMEYVDGLPLSESLDTARSARPQDQTVSRFVGPHTGERAEGVSAPPSSVGTRDWGNVDAIRSVVEIIATIARALHAAHEAGLVHRDIKPGNLMVTHDGLPKILDFGLAFDQHDTGPTLTQMGELMGTPAYMSPEQIRAGTAHIDRRTDVYSLGVVLFECLTLRRPFESPTREGLFFAILNNDAPNLARINRAIPRDLTAIVEMALEKDIDRRYASAAAMADDLTAFAEGRPVSARTLTPVGRTVRWAKRYPARAALVGLLFVGTPVVTGLLVDRAANAEKVREADAGRVAREVDRLLTDGFLRLGELRVDRAAELLEQAIERAPTPPQAAVGALAVARIMNQPGDRRVRTIDEFRATYPNVRGLDYLRATALSLAGKKEEAAILRERLGEPTREVECFLAALPAGLGMERSVEAARQAYRWVTKSILHSANPRAYYCFLRAALAARCDDQAAAVDTADVLIARWPDHEGTWFYAGLGYTDANPTKAIECYERAIALRPLPNVIYNLANVLRTEGRIEEAAARYQDAIARKPHYFDAYVNLGFCLIELKKREDAIAALRKAIEVNPTDYRPFTMLGNLFRDDRPRAAEALYAKAVTLDPKDGRVHYEHGSVLGKLGAKDRALAAFRKAADCFRATIARSPRSFDAYLDLASCLVELNKPEEAIAAARKASEIDPNHPRPYAMLGDLFRADRLRDAEANYAKSLSLDPTNGPAHYEHGNVLRRLGSMDRALVAYEKAAKWAPDNARHQFAVGNANFMLGRHEKAVKGYRATLRLAPKKRFVYFNLGQSLMVLQRYDEAIDAFDIAIDRGEQLEASYRSIGRIRREQRDYEASIDAYREAIRIAPRSANAHCGLGFTLLLASRPREALMEFRIGDRLGAQTRGWTVKSAQWVADAEQALLIQIRRSLAKGLATDAIESSGGADSRKVAEDGLRELLAGWKRTLADGGSDRIRRLARRVAKDEAFAPLRAAAPAIPLSEDERGRWCNLLTDLDGIATAKG